MDLSITMKNNAARKKGKFILIFVNILFILKILDYQQNSMAKTLFSIVYSGSESIYILVL